MIVSLQIIVQDKMTRGPGLKVFENIEISDEKYFLDGPVTPKVAVLDFDSDTGKLNPGAHFNAPVPGKTHGSYTIADMNDLDGRDLNQVSVYATVKKTIQMFEEEDTLGRPVVWGFDAPQLLVVPRAGCWENAFYERNSHSLQFFYFENPNQPGDFVYTSLSRDIVSHETGHAIVDGIARRLYDAITPQSLALHEAIADLVCLLIAFRSRTLADAILKQNDGSIENSTDFSSVAEEFGKALDATGHVGYLRNLLNQKTLDPDDTSCDANGTPNLVSRAEPHELSQVLSGALYAVMVRIHNTLKNGYVEKDGMQRIPASGKALRNGSERFKRMILRAVDYLPPGEITFADYGRAILAADQASHPDSDQERKWLIDEFTRRKIVHDSRELDVTTNIEVPAVKALNLQNLVESDWVAYQFANKNRGLLCIPHGIPFEIEPRLDVSKTYYHRDGAKKTRECILKVSWSQVEANPIGARFAAQRKYIVGTTLAIDWETHKVRALVTTASKVRRKEYNQASKDRNEFLKKLADENVLVPDRPALKAEGNELRDVISAHEVEGVMRLRGMARMLHMIRRK